MPIFLSITPRSMRKYFTGLKKPWQALYPPLKTKPSLFLWGCLFSTGSIYNIWQDSDKNHGENNGYFVSFDLWHDMLQTCAPWLPLQLRFHGCVNQQCSVRGANVEQHKPPVCLPEQDVVSPPSLSRQKSISFSISVASVLTFSEKRKKKLMLLIHWFLLRQWSSYIF